MKNQTKHVPKQESAYSPSEPVDQSIQFPQENTWHLAKSDFEAKLSEFEFLLWRLIYSFQKWHEDCQRSISDDDITANEIALLHLIRLRERPKEISEIAKMINRDDMSNVQYSLRKLTKLKLIRKIKRLSKKNVVYEITEKGIEVTDKYGDFRRNILVHALQKNQSIDWETNMKILIDFKIFYDEASLNAAFVGKKFLYNK